MAEISVKVGKKADDSGLDKSKIFKGEKPTEKKLSAEAQGDYVTTVHCPYCYALNTGWTGDGYAWGWYCWNCGGYFTY